MNLRALLSSLLGVSSPGSPIGSKEKSVSQEKRVDPDFRLIERLLLIETAAVLHRVPALRIERARWLECTGRVREAIAELEHVVETSRGGPRKNDDLDPELHREALEALARLLERSAEYSRAREVWEALAAQTSSPEERLSAWQAAYRCAERSGAAEAERQSLALRIARQLSGVPQSDELADWYQRAGLVSWLPSQLLDEYVQLLQFPGSRVGHTVPHLHRVVQTLTSLWLSSPRSKQRRDALVAHPSWSTLKSDHRRILLGAIMERLGDPQEWAHSLVGAYAVEWLLWERSSRTPMLEALLAARCGTECGAVHRVVRLIDALADSVGPCWAQVLEYMRPRLGACSNEEALRVLAERMLALDTSSILLISEVLVQDWCQLRGAVATPDLLDALLDQAGMMALRGDDWIPILRAIFTALEHGLSTAEHGRPLKRTVEIAQTEGLLSLLEDYPRLVTGLRDLLPPDHAERVLALLLSEREHPFRDVATATALLQILKAMPADDKVADWWLNLLRRLRVSETSPRDEWDRYIDQWNRAVPLAVRRVIQREVGLAEELGQQLERIGSPVARLLAARIAVWSGDYDGAWRAIIAAIESGGPAGQTSAPIAKQARVLVSFFEEWSVLQNHLHEAMLLDFLGAWTRSSTRLAVLASQPEQTRILFKHLFGSVAPDVIGRLGIDLVMRVLLSVDWPDQYRAGIIHLWVDGKENDRESLRRFLDQAESAIAAVRQSAALRSVLRRVFLLVDWWPSAPDSGALWIELLLEDEQWDVALSDVFARLLERAASTALPYQVVRRITQVGAAQVASLPDETLLQVFALGVNVADPETIDEEMIRWLLDVGRRSLQSNPEAAWHLWLELLRLLTMPQMIQRPEGSRLLKKWWNCLFEVTRSQGALYANFSVSFDEALCSEHWVSLGLVATRLAVAGGHTQTAQSFLEEALLRLAEASEKMPANIVDVLVWVAVQELDQWRGTISTRLALALCLLVEYAQVTEFVTDRVLLQLSEALSQIPLGDLAEQLISLAQRGKPVVLLLRLWYAKAGPAQRDEFLRLLAEKGLFTCQAPLLPDFIKELVRLIRPTDPQQLSFLLTLGASDLARVVQLVADAVDQGEAMPDDLATLAHWTRVRRLEHSALDWAGEVLSRSCGNAKDQVLCLRSCLYVIAGPAGLSWLERALSEQPRLFWEVIEQADRKLVADPDLADAVSALRITARWLETRGQAVLRARSVHPPTEDLRALEMELADDLKSQEKARGWITAVQDVFGWVRVSQAAYDQRTYDSAMRLCRVAFDPLGRRRW